MKFNLRSLFLGSCALVLGCNDPGSAEDAADNTAKAVQPVVAAASLGAVPVSLNSNGIPHFIRGGDQMPAMPAATATESARQHLARLAPAWGLRSVAKMPQLDAIGEVPVRGGTIVRFRQSLDGIPVEPTAGGELRVFVRGDGSMVAASGVMVSSDAHRSSVDNFIDKDDSAAIARAVSDLYKTPVSSQRLARTRKAPDGSNIVTGQSDAVNVSLSRARKAWVPQGKGLTPAWIVEAYSSNNNSTDGDAYRTVVSASGKVLSRTNLKESDTAYTYNVWAENSGEFHPADGPELDSSPNTLAAPMLFPSHRTFPTIQAQTPVTVVGTNHPANKNAPDAWLPDGSVQTQGNNVDAYTDATPPDGLSNGDFRADTLTAGGTSFVRTYDFTKSAIATDDQQKVGITSLFYLINWMHDFWYDGGFIETAGNGQATNLGRGGEGGDPVLAEAQDNSRGPNGGSRDNANMATPSDGMSGKMQVFVWDNEDGRTLTAATTPYGSGTAAYGSTTFDASGTLILAASGALSTGCVALTGGPYTGKIVVIDRGGCSFKTKTKNAQDAGAAGVIIANNAVGPAPGLADDASITTPITIPTLSVSQADGTAIKAAIADTTTGAKTATMHRALQPDLEGTFDITVVGHEFGHFVHHRLTSCNTTLCRAMSEGWADFSALLVSSRQGDDFDAQFPMGIWSVKGTSVDPVFYGIRRAPYTTNHAINALSYRHMQQGEPLPAAPFQAGDTSINNEVHNSGEVWASMLWEGYVALQKDGGSANFDATRLKMRQYVVAGLLMAPTDATPTETRDAVLTAARASSQHDHDLLYAAYAKRGFGSCAISPDRSSVTFKPITESAELKGRVGLTALDVTRPTSCDNDEVLDPGEVMQIEVPITNPGPAKMTNVRATLSSGVVDIVGDATVKLGDMDAYNGMAKATFQVKLKSAVARPTESDITIDLESDDGCPKVTVPLVDRFDTDDMLAASPNDDFNAGASAWTASHVVNTSAPDTGELWLHERDSGLEGSQFGEDSGIASDASLTSPPLTAGSDPVTISFEHLFLFEAANPGTAGERDFDGGVIEYALDGSEDWKDISELADPGYNTMLDGTTSSTDNVLAGRPAFGFKNDSFPDIDTVTLDLGTQLAGKTFRIRFRIGTDSGNGAAAAGWVIDNLKTTGLKNTPFPALIADGNHCAPAAGPDNKDDSGCCSTNGGMGTANLAAAFGVLGLVLRRRRKAAKA